jgi:hypothetical protein
LAKSQRELISHQEGGEQRVWIEGRWGHLVHCNPYIAAHDEKMQKILLVYKEVKEQLRYKMCENLKQRSILHKKSRSEGVLY